MWKYLRLLSLHAEKGETIYMKFSVAMCFDQAKDIVCWWYGKCGLYGVLSIKCVMLCERVTLTRCCRSPSVSVAESSILLNLSRQLVACGARSASSGARSARPVPSDTSVPRRSSSAPHSSFASCSLTTHTHSTILCKQLMRSNTWFTLEINNLNWFTP